MNNYKSKEQKSTGKDYRRRARKRMQNGAWYLPLAVKVVMVEVQRCLLVLVFQTVTIFASLDMREVKNQEKVEYKFSLCEYVCVCV